MDDEMTFNHDCKKNNFWCFQYREDSELVLKCEIGEEDDRCIEDDVFIKFCPFCGYCPENERESIKGTWDKKYYLFEYSPIMVNWQDCGEVKTKKEAMQWFNKNPNYRKYVEWEKVQNK